MENIELIQKGIRILLPYYAGYVAQEMRQTYKDDWWTEIRRLLADNQYDVPYTGDYAECVDSLDISNCIRILDRGWNDVFKRKLSIDYRTWSKELMGIRNKISHAGMQDFSDDDTWRALDTMARICEAFDNEATEEIRELLRKFRYGSEKGTSGVTENTQTAPKSTAAVLTTAVAGLPSWRDVIEPHPDVAQGRYKNAEFAVNLAQVARVSVDSKDTDYKKIAYEYVDPVEFFNRTYITEGMTGLLVQGLKRVTGKDGEPVIQLKTAFGGGKTHSMLALYHMMKGNLPLAKVPQLQKVLDAAGVTSLPRANVAVLVGTALDPAKPKRPNNFAGNSINTLWGEMAYQLCMSAGDPLLYDYVKEADKKGVSPGSVALTDLFNACGPCLILMDELVAYGKKLYGVEGLPAGTFDNFITFIQEITEAASASKNSIVVASIPESEREIGGDAGQIALEHIEHTFGRMESIWKPVTAGEGFEIVRRRLFLDCKNESARDQVCRAFSQMYDTNPSDFPPESKEMDYQRRMVSCYPIHPEVFDRLYEDWATLESFQRTRGVLRLMAAVIHELWMSNDASPMIMPCSIALDVPNIRDELTRYLPEGWNGIVDKEVDGKNSVPFQKDKGTPRYGKILAARRVTRTIMLGSAPTDRTQKVRGIEKTRIRLGVVQPGENIADFNDALSELSRSLAYLYTNDSGDRYWFDTRATLRKTVEDRISKFSLDDVYYEIEKRLNKIHREPPFSGIHICPRSSLDVPDDQSVRLVLLPPEKTHKTGKTDSDAMNAAREILDNRGTSPRLYRNMIAFVAADQNQMNELISEVRRYLAWDSVKQDTEILNLDTTQIRETDRSIKRCSDTINLSISNEVYCHLLTPYIDRLNDIKEIVWEENRINGSGDSIIKKAAQKMVQNEALITNWAPALLKMALDDLLWKDSNDITIKKLWDYLCTYCYLPRLANVDVLYDAIRKGMPSGEYFALAGAYQDDRYIDLILAKPESVLSNSDLLVKVDVAKEQIERESKPKPPTTAPGGGDSPFGRDNGGDTPHIGDDGDYHGGETPPPTPPAQKKTRFYMSATLDNTRINRDVQNLVDEVISHISAQGGRVKITLDVEAECSEGYTQPTIRAVNENCKTLHVKTFEFED